MKARDVFGIIVRSLGVCLLLFSFWHLVFAFAFTFEVLPKSVYNDYYGGRDPFIYYVPGVPSFLVAVVMLRFGRQIVRFSYPKDKDDTDA